MKQTDLWSDFSDWGDLVVGGVEEVTKTMVIDNRADSPKLRTAAKDKWHAYMQNEGMSDVDIENNIYCLEEVITPSLKYQDNDDFSDYLVVARAQSGKTNMQLGLSMWASENGSDIIVILTGSAAGETPRGQTIDRLKEMDIEDAVVIGESTEELLSARNKHISVATGYGKDLGESNYHRHFIDAKMALDNGKKLIFCTKKSTSSMEALITIFKLLHKDNSNSLRSSGITILDDECDWGSVDTQKRGGVAELMIRIKTFSKAHFAFVNSVAFTATPHANIANDRKLEGAMRFNGVALLPESKAYFSSESMWSDKHVFVNEEITYNNAQSDKALMQFTIQWLAHAVAMDINGVSQMEFTGLISTGVRNDGVNTNTAVRLASIVSKEYCGYEKTELRKGFVGEIIGVEGNEVVIRDSKELLDGEVNVDEFMAMMEKVRLKTETIHENGDKGSVSFQNRVKRYRIIVSGHIASRAKTYKGLFGMMIGLADSVSDDTAHQKERLLGYRDDMESFVFVQANQATIDRYRLNNKNWRDIKSQIIDCEGMTKGELRDVQWVLGKKATSYNKIRNCTTVAFVGDNVGLSGASISTNEVYVGGEGQQNLWKVKGLISKAKDYGLSEDKNGKGYFATMNTAQVAEILTDFELPIKTQDNGNMQALFNDLKKNEAGYENGFDVVIRAGSGEELMNGFHCVGRTVTTLSPYTIKSSWDSDGDISLCLADGDFDAVRNEFRIDEEYKEEYTDENDVIRTRTKIRKKFASGYRDGVKSKLIRPIVLIYAFTGTNKVKSKQDNVCHDGVAFSVSFPIEGGEKKSVDVQMKKVNRT